MATIQGGAARQAHAVVAGFIPAPGRGVPTVGVDRKWGSLPVLHLGSYPCGSWHSSRPQAVPISHSSLFLGLALAEYDQPYGGLLDILRGGTERLFTNIKDTSSKVIQSVAK